MSARRQPRTVSTGRTNVSPVRSPRQGGDFDLFHGARGTIINSKLGDIGTIPLSPRSQIASNHDTLRASTRALTTYGVAASPGTLPILPLISPRNTRSGANPHYPISMTRHMVQEEVGGAGYISPREQFGSETFLAQQRKDKEQRIALDALHASKKGQAERDIISGRAEAERVRQHKESKRIEAKKAQREAYENCVFEIAEKEKRRARNWM